MFGDVTFAQSPFASLGGATFGVNISESAVANNVQSVLTTFAGTEAELAAAAATQSVIANMFVSQNERASLHIYRYKTIQAVTKKGNEKKIK